MLGKINPRVEEVRADEVRQGDVLASGAFQPFAMANAHSGEQVLEVSAKSGLVYVVGASAPDYAWTLAPDEAVMIVKES
jgi:hypothetical protein